MNRQLEQALLDSNEHAVAVEMAKYKIEKKAVELGHQASHDGLQAYQIVDISSIISVSWSGAAQARNHAPL